MRLSHLIACAALAALPALSGCLAAGVVGGVVLSQELMDNNTYVSHLNRDAREVWATVKVSLADWSLEVIDYDDNARIAKADIDGSKVTVAVETYDLNKSVMKVSARKFGVSNGEMAQLITERLHARLR
jgi:hypothetical protein